MTDLKSFITAQQAARQSRPDQQVDWSRRKEKWISELDALLERIQTQLQAAGMIRDQIEVTHHRIQEETLGSYVANGLKLDIGLGWVTFEPIGSVIIGGYGRVDVKGPARDEKVKLIAHDANEQRSQEDQTPSYERDWTWSVYPERASRTCYPLDEAGLARLLETVVGAA